MKHRKISFIVVVGALVSGLTTFAIADLGAIVEHTIPTAGSQPVSIVTGPDGALWFTEFAGNKVGRIATDGSISEYPIPTPASAPDDMAVGADGDLWFAETAGGKVGRITPGGSIEDFPVPPPATRPTVAAQPTAVAPGRDGNLWFTERAQAAPSGQLGLITPERVTEMVPLPSTGGHPLVITPGPDGNLWFTESPGNRIGRVDPVSREVTEFSVPTPLSAPWEIAAGPDGNLWFTERLGNKIGRITPDGVISEFPVPTPASMPNTIRRGPDPNPAEDCSFQRDTLGTTAFAVRYGTFGRCIASLATTKTLWFTEQSANRLAQITTDGDVFEYALPTAGSQPGGLTQGPDGAVWFAQIAGNTIGRLDVKSVGKPVAAAGHGDGNDHE